MPDTEPTNGRKLAKHCRTLNRPGNRKKVEALIVQGLSDGAIARQLGYSRQAITGFRHRHAEEVQAVIAEVERQITDYAIAHKVNRIAGLQALADKVEAYINDRGLVERTVTTTEQAEIVRERFAREVAAELRAIYRDAAEELSDIARPPTVVITNDNRHYELTWQDGTPA